VQLSAAEQDRLDGRCGCDPAASASGNRHRCSGLDSRVLARCRRGGPRRWLNPRLNRRPPNLHRRRWGRRL